MTCNDLLDRMTDIVDGSVDPALRAEVDAHLASCARCQALVADLQRITQAAASLNRASPPAGTWARVAARLEADPELRRASGMAKAAGRGGFVPANWAWLGLAAALLLFVGGGLWLVSRSLQAPGPAAIAGGAGNAVGSNAVESVEAELQLAADHYEKAITALEQVASQSDDPLDPELTAMLRQNLEVIDKAIDESRGALKAQPESRVAQESLFEAFRRKIALLQDTIALMNEMRKGNQAGAARIVEGLNKS
jgi:anti-sigma factor RsiW